MRINRMLKRELRALNHRYEGPLNPEDEMAKYRLIPVKRLITKLGLSDWYHDAPLAETDFSTDKTTLLLRQHITPAPSHVCSKAIALFAVNALPMCRQAH